jgi:vitamin B12 transporter
MKNQFFCKNTRHLPLLAGFPLLSLFSMVSTASHADTSIDPSLPAVVVTANRMPTKLSDVIADISVIDRAEIELAGQGSLIDILSQQAGIQMSRNGGYRSTTGLFLRGASSSQVIVLIDGVRIGSATSGGASIENIPLEHIERIEILRGAASALYGPDAVGGVIQIFTREPEARQKMSASIGAGSDGQKQANAAISGNAAGVGYSFAVATERADGFSVIVNPNASGFNVDADGFKSTSFSGKLNSKLSKEHQLSLSVLHSKTDYQFDSLPSPNPLKLTKATSDAWSHANLNSVNAQWQAQWLPQWKSTIVVGQSDDKSVTDYFRINDHAFGGKSRFNTQRQQASWQNDVSLGGDQLSFTIDQRKEEVDSTTSYSVKERDLRAAVLSYGLQRGDWDALAVIRNDYNSQFGSFNNWSLSGAYKILSSWRLVANAGTSFQAPSFNQLYFPGFGNTALTPQRNRSNEVGVKYLTDAQSFSAIVYQNEVQGFINPSTNVQSALATLRGATLSAAWQNGATQYSASYDYADPRTKPNNLRLVRIARNTVNLRVRHQLQDVAIFSELKLASEREDSNLSFNGRDKLGGYALVNLGANWKITQDFSLLMRANNILDKQYALANTYSTPGRNLFVSLSWRN